MTNASDSEDESHDNHENDNEIHSQEDPDSYTTTIPNHRPKWAHKLIEATRGIVADPDD